MNAIRRFAPEGIVIVVGIALQLGGYRNESLAWGLIAFGGLWAVVALVTWKPLLDGFRAAPRLRLTVKQPSDGAHGVHTTASNHQGESRRHAVSRQYRADSDGLSWLLDGWKRWRTGEKEMVVRADCREHKVPILCQTEFNDVRSIHMATQILKAGGRLYCPGDFEGSAHQVKLTESTSWDAAELLAKARLQRVLEDTYGDDDE